MRCERTRLLNAPEALDRIRDDALRADGLGALLGRQIA